MFKAYVCTRALIRLGAALPKRSRWAVFAKCIIMLDFGPLQMTKSPRKITKSECEEICGVMSKSISGCGSSSIDQNRAQNLCQLLFHKTL